MWNQLPVPSGTLYNWDPLSTYIQKLPFFEDMTMTPPGPHGVKNAYCLLSLEDSITTDHISPSGSIHKDSPATRYLMEHRVKHKDFNSYGSHRGNHEVMIRGTFANIRPVNKLLDGEVGPKTIHFPTGEKLSIFDVAMVRISFFHLQQEICYLFPFILFQSVKLMGIFTLDSILNWQRYKSEGHDTIVLAGADYGSGRSQDWAAKGPMLLVSFQQLLYSIENL